MSLTRDIPFTITAHKEVLLATCSALVTTGSTGVATPIAITTAEALISTGDIGNVNSTVQGDQVSSGGMVESTQGRIIDRILDIPQAGAHYQGAYVYAHLNSTRGSTEADRKLAVGCELWAGDSSGGGDMAAYSTEFNPRDRVFGTSARTTDMLSWDVTQSSGPVFLSAGGYYDLRGAGRYLLVVPRFGKNSVTTESSGDEQARAGATIAFAAGDVLPEGLDTTSPFSTSTSTG